MTANDILKTAKYLKAECGVRYWEDASVNGEEDVNGDLIPCRVGETWAPVIERATGRIEDWPAGTTATTHYKVCDDGRYALLNEAREVVASIDGYVPTIMSPGDPGSSDYVIMTVGADGVIENWDIDLEEFHEALVEAFSQ